jgi:glycerol-3-phosphate dehydrogenase
MTKKEFSVKSKVVVNCAGIHSDELRKKDDESVDSRICGARGTHLMFKKGIVNEDTGIIIPKTKDGRLIFIINYLGHPMVGTTDEKCDITHYCEPDQKEIDFICEELKPYFGEDYDYKENLVAAWAGIRPLVKESAKDKKTEEEDKVEILSKKQKFKNFLTGRIRWLAFKLHDGKKKKSSDTA